MCTVQTTRVANDKQRPLDAMKTRCDEIPDHSWPSYLLTQHGNHAARNAHKKTGGTDQEHIVERVVYHISTDNNIRYVLRWYGYTTHDDIKRHLNAYQYTLYRITGTKRAQNLKKGKTKF